ncbi:gag-pol protein [Lasius niger]|uniref:Gag-pol protein n=1 Tax=Lasius niger TaxID=67767 RepID=A0A0J7KIU4_LASNI|nr:gag-pol protein [Lasius niger]
MRQVRPTPTTHHVKRKAFSHKELEDCTHVFVRVDRPKSSLEPPYKGPFKVNDRLSEYLYKINYKKRPTEINIDRLKPAILENEEVAQEIASAASYNNSDSLLQNSSTDRNKVKKQRQSKQSAIRVPPGESLEGE